MNKDKMLNEIRKRLIKKENAITNNSITAEELYNHEYKRKRRKTKDYEKVKDCWS